MIALECLAHPLDGAGLVIAPGDGAIDLHRGQRLLAGAALVHQHQFILFQEALHAARRIVAVVPQPGVIAIGVEHDRPHAAFGLQAIGIEFRLLLAGARVFAGALGLYHRQRFVVIAPQHIVGKAVALSVRHPLERIFAVAPLGQRPAGLAQQQVDKGVARLGLVVIVRIGPGLIGGLGGGHLGLQAPDLGLQFGARVLGFQPFGLGLLARLDLLHIASCRFLKLAQFQRIDAGRARQSVGGKGQGGRRLFAFGIGMDQPVADMKQLAHDGEGALALNRPRVMHGAIAQILDQLGLGDDAVAGQGAEARLMDQRGQCLFIGFFQRPVVGIEPLDGGFQRQPPVETGGARIVQRRRLGLARMVMDCGEFRRKEGELRHGQRFPHGVL